MRALELVRDEGPETVYTGTIARELVALSDARGGIVTADDLRTYEAHWSEPVEVAYAGTRFLTRAGLSGVPRALARLGAIPNLVTVDRSGNACVLTTSLGLGSGDYLPGLDLHLNSMLGEADLVRGQLTPGERMGSMMAPSLAIDADGLALAIGAAGGTRLRTALLLVASAILDEAMEPQAAVDRPRFHPVARLLNAEPGVPEAALAELESHGWTTRVWPGLHHYFGGVSVIGRNGAAGDPRRSGAARGAA